MSAVSEKFVKKTIKLIADKTDMDYSELKSVCKKILRDARNNDESLLGSMEELIDLTMVSSEEELRDFDINTLKIYCKIKEIDGSGSDKEIRRNVWAHFEEELEMESDDSDSEAESESEPESEPEPEPVVIKKKKSKVVTITEPVVNES